MFVFLFQGKPYTSIEPGTELNDVCIVPDTGLLFMANEAPKMLTYYIPVSYEESAHIICKYTVAFKAVFISTFFS